ncbi:DUF5977 domain-containing protein [Ornithobacterium rhinotracheale]|uniref:DUF5977 domain-containing protein n=1 Tax=Ornithobacterium rhinotracheale TaxID=28251 RepID=UPI001FF34715|nr:hypothetical protein [Ornithobacterium rhinotracheale]MCK0204904.1 hypothetical protein [Ornithobacterium rhinotracheale]
MKRVLVFLILFFSGIAINAQVVLQALEAPKTYTSSQRQSFSKNFTRNNCASGYTGTAVIYQREATATATYSEPSRC